MWGIIEAYINIYSDFMTWVMIIDYIMWKRLETRIPIYGEILILRSPIINYRDHSTINSHDIMRHARAQCTSVAMVARVCDRER